jgi:hypothetical protein
VRSALPWVVRICLCILLAACAPSERGHSLERGCYVLTPSEPLAKYLSNRWASSIELADSNHVRPLSDSLSAGAFWRLHQLARRWSADSTTTLLFSTGDEVTEMSLQIVGDSVFGTADFPTDVVGPTVPRVHVIGTRTRCTRGA